MSASDIASHIVKRKYVRQTSPVINWKPRKVKLEKGEEISRAQSRAFWLKRGATKEAQKRLGARVRTLLREYADG